MSLSCDGELCGYAKDFCCRSGQICITNEANIADCTPATALAGQGGWLTFGTTNVGIVDVQVTKVETPSSYNGSPTAIVLGPTTEPHTSTTTSTSARSEETSLYTSTLRSSLSRPTTTTSSTSSLSTGMTSTITPKPPLQISPNKGLSTGAKAGIGAGCAVGILIFIFLTILYRRRQRRQHVDPQNDPGHSSIDEKPELPGIEGKNGANFVFKWKPELPGAPKNGIFGWRIPGSSKPRRYELLQERYELGSDEKTPSSTETQDERQPNTKGREERPRIVSVPPAARIASKDVTASSLSSPLSPSLTEPLPDPSDLYPPPAPLKPEKEPDPNYQTRRREEKHTMITERERLALEKAKLAREEEELRRRIALHARAASAS